MKSILFWTLIFINAIQFFSCEKEKTITKYIEKEYSWKKSDAFIHQNKILLNSKVIGDQLYVAGYQRFTSFDSAINPGERYVVEFSLQSKPIITKDILAIPFTDLSGFIFLLKDYPVTSGANLYKKIQHIDSTFSKDARIAFNSYRKNYFGAFNSNNVFFTFVRDSSRMYLIEIEMELLGVYGNILNIKNYKKTLIADYNNNWFNYLVSAYSVGNDIIMCSEYKTYLISSEGKFTEVLPYRLYNVFEFENIIYALNDFDLIRSYDGGVSWETYISNFPSRNSKFFSVDNRLCYYVGHQIAELVVNGNSSYELDNDGLEDLEITSITEFADKVFVTTLNGMFYKELDDFFQKKEEKYK